jgi:hypothetical protein
LKWRGGANFKNSQKSMAFFACFLVEVNYTYGPIDVPICEGDELALELKKVS